MFAILTGAIGGIALVLCVIGLYGLTASVVGQRTREMGVRVALGAKPSDLLRMLLWDSLRPVVIGLALGAGVAILIGQVVIAAVFFGVSPNDPLALGGAIATLLAAAILAVLVPTRRAVELDPATVLKRS
jgi:ABC-type antimicrobial peptide transport system permease subunit